MSAAANNFRVALAQINTTVGDLDGNVATIRKGLAQARSAGADLVAFPELAITGYPPEDLLFKPGFLADNRAALESLIPDTKGVTAVVGFVDINDDVHNAAAVLSDGKLIGIYHKQYLPTYGVFDEDRYFKAGEVSPVYHLGSARVGVNICEDIWYSAGPVAVQAEAGAQVIVNINGSPFHHGKGAFRQNFLAARATDNLVYVCYLNLVGGQDELVFDGSSMVLSPEGALLAHGKQFAEDFIVADLDLSAVQRHRLKAPLLRKQGLAEPARVAQIRVEHPPAAAKHPKAKPHLEPFMEPAEEVYQALVLGTRDYVQKNGFERVLIALSGGIDSSIVAAIAVDALGPKGVVGVAMPSRYNVSDSLDDAQLLAKNLGIEFHVISIEPAFQALLSTLAGIFNGAKPNVAEENLQARIRGNIQMAISNKFGWLVLTTGNKSEMAMGYATLYGDMAGGFDPIKDVPKTLVYEISRYRNRMAGQAPGVIPERVLTKAPTAELRPNQKDTDSLPPYELLDPLLKAYVEEDKPAAELLTLGLDEATVKRVVNAVDRNEYKRRQSPPGIKITPRAFGRDRRLPIVNKYRTFK